MRPAKAFVFLIAAIATARGVISAPAWAEDLERKACFVDAKRLCPTEVKALSRSRVRVCLLARVEQTSLGCHAFILKAQADKKAGTKGAAR
ncbi:hypothetical protein NDN01_17895 [Sphingomonas sp. QA11]|uniref:hypothetical protein n=1 Tax=Sphingomonas sp. QA11 TaxID=2950605 RepID=UPI00234AE868|nr:hypothetical protein [Sphingomonas sp. QA11]WCM25885.1 hypothetical protein NDN01_17895 [Sphingomonas sp. QA11]